MTRCAACDAVVPSSTAECPSCGFAPSMVDGFLAYAPQFAHQGGGFDADAFAQLAALEEGNFWFRSRNSLLLWALRKHCSGLRRYLEIGCGTGYVLQGVAAAFPAAQLSGTEIFTNGLRFASRRVPRASFLQMDARHIPFESEYDVVGAFDVIEHIAEDEAVLAQAWRALKPGGFLFVTVPQHRWLWSPSDDYAHHERRYGKAELHAKVEAAGFGIVRSTSFVSLLLPFLLASRLKSRNDAVAYDPTAEMRIPPFLNALLYGVMCVEKGLIQLGLSLPVGGSRLLVARKPETDRSQ